MCKYVASNYIKYPCFVEKLRLILIHGLLTISFTERRTNCCTSHTVHIVNYFSNLHQTVKVHNYALHWILELFRQCGTFFKSSLEAMMICFKMSKLPCHCYKYIETPRSDYKMKKQKILLFRKK
jgi:hypothetical protein